MKENLIIFNAHIVTPLGFSAQKGPEMSKLLVIENGTIEVTDGIITYVGPVRGNEKSGFHWGYYQYNAEGRCILPGFVDSHTHFVFGGERSEEFTRRLRGETYMSIMEQGGGITATVNSTRSMTFDRLKTRARQFLKKMTEMGVTTVEGKSGYGLNRDTEIMQLEIMKSLDNEERKTIDIVSTFLGAHAIPDEYNGKADEYIDFLIKEMLPEIKGRQLAECCDVFCEKGVFSMEQSRRLLKAAKELGFLLKIHADEIIPSAGAELAAWIGAVSADHLLQTSDTGIKALSESGVVATLLPLTAFILKQPYAKARKMIDSGCAVALATDLNPGSSFSGSIPLTIALACIYMGLSVEEAITALTLNGAAAVNRADTIGSIEVGKKGDLVILNSKNYNILTYYVGMNCVEMTVKEGTLYPNHHTSTS